jgi:hypothetical protein
MDVATEFVDLSRAVADEFARTFRFPEIDPETGRRGDWVCTESGGGFFPFDPRPDEVHVTDIAQALSNQCRYGGAVRRFYSVGEHAILVSIALERAYPDRPELALCGLHHDDDEAYLVDIPKPVKIFLPMYSLIAAPIYACISEALDLPLHLMHAPEIKEFDTRIVADERPVALYPQRRPYSYVGEPLGVEVRCLPAGESKLPFLERHYDLVARCAARAHLSGALEPAI